MAVKALCAWMVLRTHIMYVLVITQTAGAGSPSEGRVIFKILKKYTSAYLKGTRIVLEDVTFLSQ